MKKSYIPILFLIVSLQTDTMAQQRISGRKEEIAAYKQLLQQLFSKQSATALKASGLSQRVIAEGDGSPEDSIHYTYSGGRGSRFDFNFMVYPNQEWMPEPHTLINSMLFFDMSGFMPDTTKTWTLSAGLAPLTAYVFADVYNNNNLPASSLFTGDPNNNNTMTYYYYNQQNQISAQSAWSVSVSGTPTSRIDSIQYFYTPQGKLTGDTTYRFSVNNSPYVIDTRTLSYDSNNNLVNVSYYGPANSWSIEKNISITYDNNNRVQTSTINVFEPGSTNITSHVKDSFAYNNGVPFFTYRKNWDDDMPPGAGHEYHYRTEITKHLNAQLLPDTIFTNVISHVDTSTYNTSYFNVYSYNSYNNPEYIFNYDGTRIYTYYYEEYNPAKISGVPVNKPDILVHPNPASRIFFIQYKDPQKDPQKDPATIHLINAMGQVVMSQQTSWQNGAEQLNISNLTNGIYWISITAKDGALLYRQAIVKQ
ncbi:T9SS type A sorting domain-containing protein [Chitinophagaceae bacterium MMS25-I14]